MSKPARPTAQWTTSRILSISLPIRILIGITTRTFFQPDEYWQSLEPAHRWVFGYGYETWEWRTSGAIRSSLGWVHVAGVYLVLKKLGWDDGEMLIQAPKLMQAVIASFCDVATVHLSVRLFNESIAPYALLCTLASFFNGHALGRTFSNSTETTLTTIALTLWPVEPSSLHKTDRNLEWRRFTLALGLAAITCILRPSNAVIWFILGFQLLWDTKSAKSRNRILLTVLGVGTTAIVLCYAIDTAFYGIPTFTPINFLLENVFNSISTFYGSSVSHYYVTQALPIMLLGMLPAFLLGLNRYIRERGRRKWVLPGVVGTIGVYSLLEHKEWRFIHFLLPIFHCLSAYGLSLPRSPRLSRLLVGLTTLSILPAFYLNFYHAQGQVKVMRYLHYNENVKSLGVLMPCHSTPWQSHLHRKDLEETSWFVTCEPPLNVSKESYRSEEDDFYDSPIEWTQRRFKAEEGPPSHIILFDALLPIMQPFLLEEEGYREEIRFWNSIWHDDDRRRGDVVVLSREGG